MGEWTKWGICLWANAIDNFADVQVLSTNANGGGGFQGPNIATIGGNMMDKHRINKHERF